MEEFRFDFETSLYNNTHYEIAPHPIDINPLIETTYIKKAKSWKEIDLNLSKLTRNNKTKEAGYIFENIIKYYLKSSPEYISKIKEVYLLDEVPERLRLKINLPISDEGIDLIAVTKEDKIWSIQAKYRSGNNINLTRGDLTSFTDLSFNYCKNIEHGIVFTTVEKPPKKVKYLDKVGFETLETFLKLDDNSQEGWKNLLSKISNKNIKLTPLKPKKHQIKAIKETSKYFLNNNRGKIIMPCGTGKSLTAFWISKEMKSKSILVAVPSLALLQQTLKVWTREYLANGIHSEWLCVCSDKSVSKDQDDFITNVSDIGIRVTTDSNEIKNFLKKRSKNPKIIFTTYQSGIVTSKGSKGHSYDLGIMDEAHKTVGQKEKFMAHLLDEKNIRIKKRIFMTATERVFRGDKDKYFSMDDQRVYGKIIYFLSFKEAIEMKPPIISDYKVITFNIEEAEIDELYQKNKYIKIKDKLKNITAREFATALALRKAIKKLNIKNAISFHRSIKRAESFSDQQSIINEFDEGLGKLNTFHVSGEMPTNKRTSQMREFANHKGIMTNARCLTEGVDLPAIDCVVFTDPKQSRVDIVQAAGRALRLSKGKKYGYILLPIIIPNNSDIQQIEKDNSFREIIVTLKALAAQDNRIIDHLKLIESGKISKSGSPVDGLINVKGLKEIDHVKFENSIQLKIWDRVALGNWMSFTEAKNVVKELKISSKTMFENRRKELPKNFPSHPYEVYKDNWIGWGDFFGTNTIAPKNRTYVTFEEAKKYALSLKLKGMKDWINHTQSMNFPLEMPKRPYEVYKKKWISFGDFLGTGSVASTKINFFTYKEAKKIIQKNNVKSLNEYLIFAKKTKLKKLLPIGADQVYKRKGEWVSWAEFLGVQNKRGNFASYEEVKKFALSKKLKNKNQWEQYVRNHKIPDNIPMAPASYFKRNNKWQGWKIFFKN